MANQYVNKVVFGDQTLLDLTTDTVTPSVLMEGYTAHDKSGAIITGTATGGGTGAISVVDTTDTHGGTIRTITAVDISDTTAVAQDVAQGKYFYTADGTKTEGTSTGGGGGTTLKMGVIRPDAELVKRWSYDKLIVNDEGITIPTYNTSSQTLISSGTLSDTPTMDLENYNYYLLARTLVIPIYNTNTVLAKRNEYHIHNDLYEFSYIPANTMKALVNDTYKSGPASTTRVTSAYETVYWSSTSNLVSFTTSYGVYSTISSPSYAPSGSLTVYHPAILMRGSTTYLPSDIWETITDIRVQYKIELYRAPINSGNLNGFNWKSQHLSIINDINNNNGTLT